MTVEQIDQAVAAGAEFIVAPNFDPEVVQHCIDIDVPVLPGTVTPSEVGAAEKMGLMVTKFFPAAQYGGLNTIKAICAPFTRHRFMPTGGVSLANVEDIISRRQDHRVRRHLDGQGLYVRRWRFRQVQQQAAEAINMVKKIRG